MPNPPPRLSRAERDRLYERAARSESPQARALRALLAECDALERERDAARAEEREAIVRMLVPVVNLSTFPEKWARCLVCSRLSMEGSHVHADICVVRAIRARATQEDSHG